MKIETRLSGQFKCPICDRVFCEDSPDVSMPFCSKRCKMIDTHRWLNEEYGLAHESEESEINNPE
ncbi:MAG: DNA gyrase inhibitor YacG [Planctomycetaceae bacterium]|nr:DNA gyrase inhibitor YacG [Planctomycetaceae bacterium]